MDSPLVNYFLPKDTDSKNARIDEFIRWGLPSGSGGISSIHAEHFDRDAPYFEWSPTFFADADKTARSWFLKFEFLSRGREVFSRHGTKSIINSEGLFPPGRYLDFAKSYLNVISLYRSFRSIPKQIPIALAFVEHSLREQFNGISDPSRINAVTFELSGRLLLESSIFGQSVKYDIGKELEILAGMLQSGHHSKSLRFSGKGFRLIEKSFTYVSAVPLPARKRASRLNAPDLHSVPEGRLANETVAAIGVAYRRSKTEFGNHDSRTLFSAIAGIALTTVSMRASDAVTLRRDALYRSDSPDGRTRIRIERPKTGIHQDLPIPKSLSSLAIELFESLLEHTDRASKALNFYVSKFGNDFAQVDELYVPEELRAILDKDYLTANECHEALKINLTTSPNEAFPQRLGDLEKHRFIDTPGDLWFPLDTSMVNWETRDNIGILISKLVSRARKHGYTITLPVGFHSKCYVVGWVANRFLGRTGKRHPKFLTELLADGKPVKSCIRTSDLKLYLLKQFREKAAFPHWPYTSKERCHKVCDALLVYLQPDIDSRPEQGFNEGRWWLPACIPIDGINRWLNRSNYPFSPILFRSLEIRLKSGEFPSLTLHATRRYHQTSALLAGANEAFIDELAGRNGGRQSDHYDLRSPHEILVRSIDTFDPDMLFQIVGPVAKNLKRKKLVERETFIFENAVPKHITEIGGCATDWSLEPCKHHGDCLRCDQHIWRKGDAARMKNIIHERDHAVHMIQVANTKISEFEQLPRTIELQRQRFVDNLARCDAILKIENDPSIELGAVVTFDLVAGAVSRSERTELLRLDFKAKLPPNG